ncbi:MAG: L-threonylcarbamoyladenylate synthase [Treponema sp.]|jgi:tRNA threonylcarbamoyl adenosine modification protein (Sua5/YciO/YrdC/YwlC family)|nr:L-threonylcarbamoyladenylate synthase [Treponema sp.]
MIEYVTPGNIDDRVLARAVRLLGGGGLAALPTDTSWALVCSLESKAGIKKLKSLSGERDERHFTLLCNDISQFGELCSIDNTRFRLIRRLSPGPYTFILKTLLGTEKILDIRRREVGIRIPDHPVPLALIKSLASPLYSITAKQTMIGAGDMGGKNGKHPAGTLPVGGDLEIPEEDLFEADWELEAIEGLDLIISGDEEQTRTFSTILDITGDEVQVLRQGAGQWPA